MLCRRTGIFITYFQELCFPKYVFYTSAYRFSYLYTILGAYISHLGIMTKAISPIFWGASLNVASIVVSK